MLAACFSRSVTAVTSHFLSAPTQKHHLCLCREEDNDESMGQQANLNSAPLLFLLSLCWAQREGPTCDRCDLRFSCDCSRGGFVRVPAVTDRAVSLDLSFNNITSVAKDDLRGHTHLKALLLHGNGLAEIHTSAMDSLKNLEDLDLSDNQLTFLKRQWFSELGSLRRLNVLNNPYSCVGSVPVFERLLGLRWLGFGGPALVEIKRGVLWGVTQLEELVVHANNLTRYESGALAYVWPLGHVTLSLRGPFLTNAALASTVLADVTYPETPIVLVDLHLLGSEAVQPLREAAKRRVRHMTFRNLFVTDKAIVDLLEVLDGVPVSTLSMDGVTLSGVGRWEKANWTDQRSIDSTPRMVSVINARAFVIPCATTGLFMNLQYLDLSDNLLTDLTLTETLCDGNGTLKDLRVLNISGNTLKSLSTLSRLVAKLHKLTHLDISRTHYSFMPQSCSWPSTLWHLNISGAKLTTVTPCLPTTLQVLDLSNNDLQGFTMALPTLRELHLSGNKFLKLPVGSLFPSLQTLTIQSNTLNMFSRSDLQSYRRLQNLQAGHNKFVCSCDFVPFIQSSIKGDEGVHLTDEEEGYVCDAPLYLQGQAVGHVHLSVVECHRVLFVLVCCGVLLFVGILVIVLLWRLHAFWYLGMMWAWLRAKRSSRQRRLRDAAGSEALLSFDAFVSYSERDAGWVESFLVPELEESGETDDDSPPLTLCLHKRDFLPGRWIADNIMSAIERSRQTVFVLSENFVKSEWCRYELDFSHFWLFDGNTSGQPAILILLEPLPKDNIPKRFCKLRKLMCSTTYLEWPQDDERRGEFWRSLRSVLRGRGQDD
ncbi:toll-like receptor 2 [Solea senegalensis]|uniref:Toll-like receptor 2 n=1 Tax=Solea senegalensis TaxID=28829 RepID=A0AAV6QS21_SOLSE|nr:toll-like receptor 2 [Solea senegalensis]